MTLINPIQSGHHVVWWFKVFSLCWEVRSCIGSELPVQSTPDAILWSHSRSQGKKNQFIHTPSDPPPIHPSPFNILDAPKPPTGDRFIMPDEFATPATDESGRAKRSPINSNRVGGLNVETLVVADRKMLEKHGRDNVTTYVLTVMNMVRTLFPLPGLGRIFRWNLS